MGIFASKTWHFKHILRYSEVRYHLDMRRERCMNLKLHIKSRGLGVQAIEGGSGGSTVIPAWSDDWAMPRSRYLYLS
jgi:hypothetical protein